jgi:hypothetical protein
VNTPAKVPSAAMLAIAIIDDREIVLRLFVKSWMLVSSDAAPKMMNSHIPLELLGK